MIPAKPGKADCCAPERDGAGAVPAPVPEGQGLRIPEDAVAVPGGRALVGTKVPLRPDEGESPPRHVRVRPFRIGATAVTNAQFRAFVEATGFVTEAERLGWSFVFRDQVPAHIDVTEAVAGLDWWWRVDGATWAAPAGPGTEDRCLPDHPVVQVSWSDALAYAAWVGGRLPSEAEWEHAARGGLGDVKFPWGEDEPDDEGFTPCNIWQGSFPKFNSELDGYRYTAPAKSFAPNGYGLYNMVGNVWEWTQEDYRVRTLKRRLKERMAQFRGHKLLKGGSFLCHRSYCYRYRIAARMGNTPDSTTTHAGFRVIWPD